MGGPSGLREPVPLQNPGGGKGDIPQPGAFGGETRVLHVLLSLERFNGRSSRTCWSVFTWSNFHRTEVFSPTVRQRLPSPGGGFDHRGAGFVPPLLIRLIWCLWFFR